MSSASERNFSTAARERERRMAMQLDSPGMSGLAQASYLQPSWDAFYGSLRGGGSRLSGAGMAAPDSDVSNSADANTARAIGINQYLGDLTDQRRATATTDRARSAGADIAEAQARQMAGQEQEQAQLTTALATGGQPGRAIQQNPDGSYATGEAPPPASPSEQRANILKMVPGQVGLAMQQQWAKQDADAARLETEKSKAETERVKAESAAGSGDDVSQAVSAMKDGTVPPQLPGRASKDYTKILAEAKRQGYDLATAATDWTATQKHIQTMNGAQQLRLNQAVNALPDMLDNVDTLASQWKAGRFPALNKASLVLAKQGAFGKDAASIANQLDAQIADVTADLGNVYMGGNSPTDHALELAGKSLSADWDEKVLHDMVTMAKKNVTIRQNSIKNTGVAGASANNPYGNQGASPARAATSGAQSKGADPLGIR